MMSQSRDCGLANFQVLTDGAVFGDVRFGFVAHPFVDCALSRNCRLARCFGTTASFFQGPTMSGIELAHLRSQFTFAEFVSGTLLQLCDVGGLFFRGPRLLGPSLTFREMYATAASACAR